MSDSSTNLLAAVHGLQALGYVVEPPGHHNAGVKIATRNGKPMDCWGVFKELLVERDKVLNLAAQAQRLARAHLDNDANADLARQVQTAATKMIAALEMNRKG